MKFRQFGILAENLAKMLEFVGIAGVLIMMMVTVIDVIGAKVFLNPLRGSTEIVGFGQIIAISCSIAVGLFFGRHIAIELFISLMSKRVRKYVHIFISLVGLVFFILLAWQSYNYGISLKKAGEISSSAYIPFYPFAYVLAFSSVAALMYYLNELLHYFTGRSNQNGSS